MHVALGNLNGSLGSSFRHWVDCALRFVGGGSGRIAAPKSVRYPCRMYSLWRHFILCSGWESTTLGLQDLGNVGHDPVQTMTQDVVVILDGHVGNAKTSMKNNGQNISSQCHSNLDVKRLPKCIHNKAHACAAARCSSAVRLFFGSASPLGVSESFGGSMCSVMVHP